MTTIRNFLALESETSETDGQREFVAQMQAAETQAHELVSAETQVAFQELEAAENVGEALQHDVASTVEASTALEAMAQALQRSLDRGGMNVHGIRFANLAIESVNASYGINTSALCISFEDYKKNPLGALKAAMEDIEVQAQSLWSSVKEKLASMADALVHKLTSFRKNIARLEQRAVRVEGIIGKLDAKSEMRFSALKPQEWFIDLCYHGKAAPKGLVGIGPAVEKLLKESASVMTSTIGHYNEWLKGHHAQVAVDPQAFGSLKYRTGDFLILHQKPFSDTRRLVFAKAKPDCSFYRSEELPGGMAFYTHLHRTDESGLGAVGALCQVDYRLAQYDPISYNAVKGAIFTVGAFSLNVFISAAIGAGAAVAATAAVALTGGRMLAGQAVMQAAGTMHSAASNTVHAATSGAGFDRDVHGKAYGSKIKLTPDMLFHTLTLAEAKRVLAEVHTGIAAMKAWENTVFREIYKDKEASELIQKLLDGAKGRTTAGSSVRVLKNLCFAIFNLQTGMSSKTLSYSVRTYNSMLNYVQKSSYQYS